MFLSVGAGLLVKTAGALAVMRLLRSLLCGVSERDAWAYASAIVVAIVTTLLACWLPSSRASRTEPAMALREE